MKALSLAAFAALAIQPVVFFACFLLPMLLAGARIPTNDLLGLPLIASLVAAPFVILLGIPALLLLRRLNCLSAWSLGGVGFMGAALPWALLGWTAYPGYSSGGNWHGKPVEFVVNGEKTFYGWLQYAETLSVFGLHGLFGALAFYFVWRRVSGRVAIMSAAVSQ